MGTLAETDITHHGATPAGSNTAQSDCVSVQHRLEVEAGVTVHDRPGDVGNQAGETAGSKSQLTPVDMFISLADKFP